MDKIIVVNLVGLDSTDNGQDEGQSTANSLRRINLAHAVQVGENRVTSAPKTTWLPDDEIRPKWSSFRMLSGLDDDSSTHSRQPREHRVTASTAVVGSKHLSSITIRWT